MVIIGERLGLTADGVSHRSRADGVVVGVTDANGDAVAVGTRLTSSASASASALPHRQTPR